MTTQGSRLCQLQYVAHDEAVSLQPRAETPFADVDLERSHGARRRHRVLISARQLVALFETPCDRSHRLH